MFMHFKQLKEKFTQNKLSKIMHRTITSQPWMKWLLSLIDQ